MTTETESLEALHLWLAERLPELRFIVTKSGDWGDRIPPSMKDHVARGWAPNVTTDALLEALRAQGITEVKFSMADQTTTTICSLDAYKATSFEDGVGRTSVAATLHTALCRAARKALEA